MINKFRKLTDILSFARKRAAEGGLPWLYQLQEMTHLALRYGISPGLYCKAQLYRRELSWKDKTAFMNWRKYFAAIQEINPPQYRIFAEKYITAVLFETFGVSTPETYAILAADRGMTLGGRRVTTPLELETLLRDRKLKSVCIKPIGGFNGTGFAKIEIVHRDNGLSYRRLPNEEHIDINTLWHRELDLDAGVPYICQETVEQHHEIAALHPNSLNTARIWMAQQPGEDWQMIFALLRVGTKGSVVDNTSQGGLGAPIDIETGVISDARNASELEPTLHATHPTTGSVIRDRQLPMWSEVQDFSYRVCVPFSPYLRLLGLDVAFGREGPVVIEVNAIPDLNHQIIAQFGYRPLLDRLRGINSST